MDERDFGKIINRVMSTCIKYRTCAVNQEECVNQLKALVIRLEQGKEATNDK